MQKSSHQSQVNIVYRMLMELVSGCDLIGQLKTLGQLAVFLAILELVRTALSCSLSTVLLQGVFGLPFAFRPCGLHLSTFMCSCSHYLSQFLGLVS